MMARSRVEAFQKRCEQAQINFTAGYNRAVMAWMERPIGDIADKRDLEDSKKEFEKLIDVLRGAQRSVGSAIEALEFSLGRDPSSAELPPANSEDSDT